MAGGRARQQSQPASPSPPQMMYFCHSPLITIYNVNNPPEFPHYHG